MQLFCYSLACILYSSCLRFLLINSIAGGSLHYLVNYLSPLLTIEMLSIGLREAENRILFYFRLWDLSFGIWQSQSCNKASFQYYFFKVVAPLVANEMNNRVLTRSSPNTSMTNAAVLRSFSFKGSGPSVNQYKSYYCYNLQCYHGITRICCKDNRG